MRRQLYSRFLASCVGMDDFIFRIGDTVFVLKSPIIVARAVAILAAIGIAGVWACRRRRRVSSRVAYQRRDDDHDPRP